MDQASQHESTTTDLASPIRRSMPNPRKRTGVGLLGLLRVFLNAPSRTARCSTTSCGPDRRFVTSPSWARTRACVCSGYDTRSRHPKLAGEPRRFGVLSKVGNISHRQVTTPKRFARSSCEHGTSAFNVGRMPSFVRTRSLCHHCRTKASTPRRKRNSMRYANHGN
ncbi:hypothetical protein CA13_01960 [Planctomycetes bacterium CA13]|uniref:Uncharacterized protein n=1 Tax=Novipirellula herctigrandis TaxID=2527986 RepID=A0A5C5YUT0_9BACT|nr:hypothetical protein CA13_01960 [Planctomycetes bacterium CA13]